MPLLYAKISKSIPIFSRKGIGIFFLLWTYFSAILRNFLPLKNAPTAWPFDVRITKGFWTKDVQGIAVKRFPLVHPGFLKEENEND